MGLFGKKGECAICHRDVSISYFKTAEKQFLCSKCYDKCGFKSLAPINKMTVEDIKAAIRVQEANAEELSKFNTTKKIGDLIEFDDNQKKWLIPDGFLGKKKNPKIYNYSDIVDFELLEDGETITKGGLGSAVAGGMLLGGVGAVVGGVTGKKKNKAICNSLKIKITLNNINNPVVYINFLAAATKKESLTYKTLYNSAQECLSVLQLICSSQEASSENSNVATTSNADEILKYKKLLDEGILSQEEFDAKKKQLLGL